MTPTGLDSALLGAWSEIPPDQVPAWNHRLQATPASLYQYPFWNEPLKHVLFTPVYLVHRVRERETAFVCIVTLRLAGFRMGLIKYGPVGLPDGEAVGAGAWEALLAWARERNFIFLRVTHTEEEALRTAASLPGARRTDAFTLWPEETEELRVPLRAGTLAALPHEVRRLVRRGQEAGFVTRSSVSPEDFRACWPLFQRMAAAKKINFRPRAYFQDLVELGTRAECCRIYWAEFEGRIVQALLVARTGRTACLMAGALDQERLAGGLPSPSCLLHWHAIREHAELGAETYHMGNRAGPVYPFKKKFQPVEQRVAPPVTLVLRPLMYHLWSRVVLRVSEPFLPHIRGAVQRLRDRVPARLGGARAADS